MALDSRETDIWFPAGMDLPDLANADLDRIAAEVVGKEEPRALQEAYGRQRFSDMPRRDFLRVVGGALGAALLPKRVFAAEPNKKVNTGTGGPDYDPKSVFYITHSAVGGMDWEYSAGGYLGNSDKQNGPLKSPPSNIFPGAYSYPITPGSQQEIDFLEEYGENMLFIRQHQTTNGHQEGEQMAAVGSKTDMRMPDSMAILAAQDMSGSALAYITDGGITVFPAGLIAPNSLNDLSSFLAMADPNELDPNNPKFNSQILTDPSLAALYMKRVSELEQLRNSQKLLPRARRLAKERHISQGIREQLNKFLQTVGAAQQKYPNNKMVAGGVIAMNLFKLGQTRAAKFELGGYDTHGDPAGVQTVMRNQILYGNIHLLRQEAAAIGVPLCNIVESDFGRKNVGTSAGGLSAHDEIGHTMIIHPYIKGPRLVGKADANKKLIGKPVDIVNMADVKKYIRLITGTHEAKFPGYDLILTAASTNDAVMNALKAA